MYKINDYLWKGIIEDLAPDFLSYFFTAYVENFDLSKEIEFLDKELDQLLADSKGVSRNIDKLIKVYTKNGGFLWILIHIEVQGYHDLLFSKRVYIYDYRIFDKYDIHPVTLAIFTDSLPSFQPNEYNHDLMGAKLQYSYNTYKVLEQDLEEIRSSDNPFATVIECVYVALQKGELKDEELYDLKIDLVKRLYRKNYPKPKIANLLNFIKYYIRFKDKELDKNFETEVDFITDKSYNMGVQEIILWQAKQEGIEQGIEQKTLDVATNILNAFPDWEDEKIADLAGTSVEMITKIRLQIKEK